MHTPPIPPTPKYFVGTDESYDPKTGGNFIMNFCVFNSETDLRSIKQTITEINKKNRHKESKSTKIPDHSKRTLFRSLNGTNFKNFIYHEKRLGHKSISALYIDGLKSFLNNLPRVVPPGVKIYFFLDKIGGEQFQQECIKLVRSELKKVGYKYQAGFYESFKEEILQVADILAGEYRKSFSNQNGSNFSQFLNKNKNLLN